MDKVKDYFLVAALDFGTTYSTCAYQMTSEYDPENPTNKIMHEQAWFGSQPRCFNIKTPTCLLLDRNQKIESFGHLAEEKYADLCEDGDEKEFYFFRRFKMKLYETKVILLLRNLFQCINTDSNESSGIVYIHSVLHILHYHEFIIYTNYIRFLVFYTFS